MISLRASLQTALLIDYEADTRFTSFDMLRPSGNSTFILFMDVSRRLHDARSNRGQQNAVAFAHQTRPFITSAPEEERCHSRFSI